MHYFNLILFWVFFGFLCSYLARKKGRNPQLWFWLGLFLGLVGVAAIALLPKREAKPHYEIPEHTPVQIEPSPAQQWYYLSRERATKGPYSLRELREYFKEREITPTTFLWCEGMGQWAKLSELPTLSEDLSKDLTSSP